MVSAKPKKPIKQVMSDNTLATTKDFEFEHQLLRNIGGINIELFVLIEKDAIRSKKQLAILTLATRNFRLLQCINDCIFCGYYEVSMALIRNLYENLLHISYFQKNEKETERWLNGKHFQPKFLRNKLKDESGLYGFLSNIYTHTNVESIVPIIKMFNAKKLDLKYYPLYDKEECRRNLHFSIMFGWLNNLELQYAFKDYLWKNNKWKRNFIKWNNLVLTYMQEKIIKKSKIKFEFKNKLPSGF